ncbi:unnamed protein product [Camellia sinensis]
MASSSTPPRCTYHVFLSFRGEDTRKAFTDHLYTALLGSGFRTFRDNDGIERGENVRSELDNAIRESRSSIIVFSKDYASSRWCLDELVMILEHKRTSGHVILPVFYDVDPSQVRKQMGSFAEAFGRHEERFMGETNERKKEYLRRKVEGWRVALREVADLAGMVLQNQADGHEAKFIQKIVKVIGDKLNRTVLNVAPYLIGIGSRVKNISSWLQDESTDVGIAVIYGMGGIGKTTIAKFVYNLNFERFEASSFLANVREISERSNGLIRLQRQLLSDIFKRKKEKISSVDEGIIKIKDAIGCKRVLVVLDDVDQRDQFDAIIGMRNWFHPGSKIILTTRHKQLLKANEVYMMHKVERFDDDESLELFSWHAFGQDHPIDCYVEHSKRVVQHCGGLPLALQVLGSSLSGKSLNIWENAIKKLAAIPDSQILKKLKISYDSLQDDHDQNLFLHISCFFIGKGKDFTIRILDECGFYPTVGIQNLIDRCLLTINEQNKLMMHQLLRDMGREIVRQESPKEPGKRSRLWHNNDSFNVLRDKTGTDSIEGLFLDMHVLGEDNCSMTSFGVNNAKRARFEEPSNKSLLADQGNSLKRHCFGFFSWHPINIGVRNSNQVELETDTFARMHKLRLLQLNYVETTRGYKDFPKRLRWLCWHGFPLKSIPSDFSIESLIALDLRNSRLEQVWKGTKLLGLLKFLNLSHSYGLTNTPNFNGLPNLENLILKDCINLVEVHESIGKLGRLVFLNLKGCKNLEKLPSKIGHLTSLEKLILSGCSKLDQLPELGKMKYLTVLHADGTAINRIATTTSEDKSWSSLFWSWVLKPRKSTESIYFPLASLPGSLVSLSLSNCNLSNDDLMKSLGSLSVLQDLNLSENPISSLPESIKGLNVLQSLRLSRCTRLQSLPELPMSLEMLNIDGCSSLGMVTNLPNLLRSLILDSSDCEKLVEVQGMFKLEPIGNAGAEVINKLGLVDLESMGSLEVELLNNMTSTRKKGPLQGLYECGIYSIFVPGNEVPGWCSNKGKGSSISFNVPLVLNLKIVALNVYIVYAFANDISLASHQFDYIKINNKTKGLKWTYSPMFRGIPDDNSMIWFSHWEIGHLLMEGGDKMNLSASFDELYQVKEVGVQIVYDECEEKGIQHHNAHPSLHNVMNVGDLSEYHVRTGSYFLCHHGYDSHQDYHQDGSSSKTDKILFGDSEETTVGLQMKNDEKKIERKDNSKRVTCCWQWLGREH